MGRIYDEFRNLMHLAHKSGGLVAMQESTADAPTVAWSYAAMLVYVAAALSALPRGARPAALLVHSRIGLALGGVTIVACAVVGALGKTSTSLLTLHADVLTAVQMVTSATRSTVHTHLLCRLGHCV